MGLQLAPAGHAPSPSRPPPRGVVNVAIARVDAEAEGMREEVVVPPGVHNRAQYCAPDGLSVSAHVGAAVTPAGTSDGHVLLSEAQGGEQKPPLMPVIVMFFSCASHEPLYGSP